MKNTGVASTWQMPDMSKNIIEVTSIERREEQEIFHREQPQRDRQYRGNDGVFCTQLVCSGWGVRQCCCERSLAATWRHPLNQVHNPLHVG